MTEPELVRLAQSGDERASAALVKEHHSLMLWVARRVLPRESDATLQDIVQDSWYKIFKYLDSYKPDYAFKSWAGRIVHNESVNHLRKKSRKHNNIGYRIHTVRNSEGMEDDVLEAHDFEQDILIDDALIAKERDGFGHEAFNNLPDDFRTTLGLRMSGMAYDEIAVALGVPLGTIKSRISRARSLVAESLNRRYAEGS